MELTEYTKHQLVEFAEAKKKSLAAGAAAYPDAQPDSLETVIDRLIYLTVGNEFLWHHVMTLVEEIAANQRELRDCRAFYEETRPILDAVHVYVKKHKLGIGGQDVVEILLADAEALRAEVKTLRDTKDPLFVMGFGNAAPATEPAPRRIIPNVRVKYTATDAAHRSGQLGVIVGSAVDYLEIEFEDGLVEGIKRTELESFTAPATIKVGDRVRVTSGTHEGLTGVVTEAGGGKSSILMKPDNGDMSREFPLFKVERI